MTRFVNKSKGFHEKKTKENIEITEEEITWRDKEELSYLQKKIPPKKESSHLHKQTKNVTTITPKKRNNISPSLGKQTKKKWFCQHKTMLYKKSHEKTNKPNVEPTQECWKISKKSLKFQW